MATDKPWAREEVEAIVDDYLHMLAQELAGQRYVKSTHRQYLKQRLHGRSDGSIERKHQNISAILIELGCPYIRGYKPLGNYQRLLLEVVDECLTRPQPFDKAAAAAVEQPAVEPLTMDYEQMLTAPPKPSSAGIKEQALHYGKRVPHAHRDYLAREARNRSLGSAGEALVVRYEQHRLLKAGKERLAGRVEHVSASRGDGLGYDVLSFESSGRERLIEVKTTAFGKETPFYLSRNELAVSKEERDRFYLYRVYEFRNQPRLFKLPGAIDGWCALSPESYLARF